MHVLNRKHACQAKHGCHIDRASSCKKNIIFNLKMNYKMVVHCCTIEWQADGQNYHLIILLSFGHINFIFKFSPKPSLSWSVSFFLILIFFFVKTGWDWQNNYMYIYFDFKAVQKYILKSNICIMFGLIVLGMERCLYILTTKNDNRQQCNGIKYCLPCKKERKPNS